MGKFFLIGLGAELVVLIASYFFGHNEIILYGSLAIIAIASFMGTEAIKRSKAMGTENQGQESSKLEVRPLAYVLFIIPAVLVFIWYAITYRAVIF
ncbi:hypothetical protein IWB18_00350 [Alkalibacter sp. M17DMB]|nr:hypothetical protein [Alkalibacter mobilis]